MLIHELIQRLQDLAEVYGDDAEVRMMCQENWPFEYSIRGITDSEEIAKAEAYDDGEDYEDEEREVKQPIIYLVEGRQIGYGKKSAWNLA